MSQTNRARSRELLCVVILGLKQRDISETIDFFFDMTYSTKRPDPAMTLFDG